MAPVFLIKHQHPTDPRLTWPGIIILRLGILEDLVLLNKIRGNDQNQLALDEL